MRFDSQNRTEQKVSEKMDKIIMAGLALAAEERECVMHKEGGRDEREAAGKCQ